MPIELTDKITPKNAAFTDIVDAKNVGGDGTSSNALQADAVASPAALEIVRIDSTNQYLEGIATVPVGSGGTGATTLTGYIKGSGTSALTASATIPGTDVSGNIFGNAANVTGTVAVGNGGTGQTTANAALNALLPSQATNTGKFLQTDGTNTSWQTATGGSISGLTAGRVPYASNSTTLVDDAGLTYDATTDALTAGIFQQATNNAGGFYGKGTVANDYRVFVNASNEWEIRQNVGGVVNASYKFGGANFYCEGAEDLGITTKGFGALWLKGSTSGESRLLAPTTGGGTATLFGGTDTVCGIAASQTLTNKTLTSPVISTISNTGTVTLPTFNATVGGRVASYDGTALTGVASNQLLASAAAGFYRISVFMICTRAATTSSTMGADTRVTYTPIGAAGPITHWIPMFTSGSALNADVSGITTNAVDIVLTGSIVMYIASTSVVTYNNGYTSSGATSMRYNVSVRLERID